MSEKECFVLVAGDPHRVNAGVAFFRYLIIIGIRIYSAVGTGTA
jgi:hypothetical protein